MCGRFKWRFSMKSGSLQKVFFAILAASVFLSGGNVFAQARKAGGATASTAGKSPVIIKKMELNANVRAPDYSSNASEATLVQTPWARILVRFDLNTEAEWIDQLEMKFYALVKNQKTGVYSILTGTFVYAEVPRGRNRQVAVYLRPRTTERYGVPEQAGVEINLGGETVAFAGSVGNSKWWQSSQVASLKTIDGYIMDRSQTPFALIAPDNYETLRGK